MIFGTTILSTLKCFTLVDIVHYQWHRLKIGNDVQPITVRILHGQTVNYMENIIFVFNPDNQIVAR